MARKSGHLGVSDNASPEQLAMLELMKGHLADFRMLRYPCQPGAYYQHVKNLTKLKEFLESEGCITWPVLAPLATRCGVARNKM